MVCLNTTRYNESMVNNTCDDDVNLNISINACKIINSRKVSTLMTPVEFEVVLLVVFFLFLMLSITLNVKLIKKYYNENTEPAILLELVFLTNFSALFGSAFLIKLVELASFGDLNNMACSLQFWARTSFMADLSLIYLDKVIALYWSTQYNNMVTKTRAVIACVATKTGTITWTIIFNSVYRYIHKS